MLRRSGALRRGLLQHSTLLAAIVGGLLLPAPVAAQLAGRWVVSIRSIGDAPLRGELRLHQTGRRLEGTLWLGDSDGPLAVRDGIAGPGDTVSFTAQTPAGLRFTGRIRPGGDLEGHTTAFGRPGPAWTGAPLSDAAEFYPALPRFVVRAVVSGRRDSVIRLPGPWLAAAAGSAAGLMGAYREAATAAGLPSLGGDTLTDSGPLRAMGVYGRAELVAAATRTFADIRAAIPDAGVRTRFDQLFRPRGIWQVDLHGVALARARRGAPALGPELATPALVAVALLPRQGTSDAGTVALALYRLFALQSSDSAAAAGIVERMRALEPASAQAVSRLLAGYQSASAWYADAIRFFLDEPWLPGSPAHSIGDAVREAWHDSASTPAIESRVFGYPQAVPRYGVPDALFERLVHRENWSAGEWMRRHGRGGFLEVLHRVAVEYGPGATVELRTETLRLASPRGLTGQDANGFLEARDAIAIDPGYFPLLALGAVVHEWQHLLFQRRLLLAADSSGGPIVLPGVDPFIAEGLAEWRAERILRPFIAREPLLGVAELEKRARIARTRPDDQHVLGYRLIGALAAAVPDETRMVALLEGAAIDPRGGAALLDDPAVAAAWAAFARAPGRTIPAPSRRALVPELTFTIEDEVPDLVRTRIVTP